MEARAHDMRLNIAGYETVMAGADMRASVLTLAEGECVPWHCHSQITDRFFLLHGSTVVETREPRAVHEPGVGESCEVSPNTAHTVHGQNDGMCRFLVLQGIGVYDNVAVGG